MKIVYAGTPDFAVPPLQALIQSGHEIVAVYSQPDRPAGRGKKMRASPVKQVALEADLRVIQPLNFKAAEDRQQLADLQPDLMIVAAYGLILPPEVLEIPQYGCLNIHASLLPRWRGAAPIQRAILAGDESTGITIMQMAEGLDTGDMLFKMETAIQPQDTGSSLHDRLATMGASSLMDVLEQLADEELQPVVQDDALAIYASKIDKSESNIDWQTSAADIDRKIRAFNAWPVAQTLCSFGVLRIWEASPASGSHQAVPGTVLEEGKQQGILVKTGEGSIWLRTIQLPGKKPISSRDFLNGRSLLGEVLGAAAAEGQAPKPNLVSK